MVNDHTVMYKLSFDESTRYIVRECIKIENDWATKLCCKSKTLIDVFLNNKQNITNDSVRKDVLVTYKKRQRSKDK